MEITYERQVSHCEKNPYVRVVTINSIKHAENSDNLDTVQFVEMGWNCLTMRGQYKEGDKVLFIPPDAVLPTELSDELDVTKYLSKGRVRVVKLRGNRSEGLIVDEQIATPYLDYILKWEDIPNIYMHGDSMSPSEVNPRFHIFYKMPNILNEPYTFGVGENVLISEKIHGTSFRMGILKHPFTDEMTLYVGSHLRTLKEQDGNLYWDTAKKYRDKLVPNFLYFGEIFGLGIQHLHYNRKEPDMRVFAVSNEGYYIPHNGIIDLCNSTELPCVNFTPAVFESLEQMRELAEQDSEYTISHHREGIVIVSCRHPDRMAKCISFKYLTATKRTERH